MNTSAQFQLIRFVIVSIVAVVMTLPASAQFEANYEYSRELVWGVNKNTNSGLIGGLMFKIGRIRSENVYETFGFEFINVKHPKEVKYTNAQTGSSFVWSKQNYLFALRPSYGRDILISRKAPQQGVQISLIYAGGPSIGLEAPYYVLTAGGEYVPYDPSNFMSINAILGSGKVFRSIGNANIVPGAHAKSGFSFEFGSFRNNVAGIEIGMMAEAYLREIQIMAVQPNRFFYPSGYVTFFWGSRR